MKGSVEDKLLQMVKANLDSPKNGGTGLGGLNMFNTNV